MTQTLNRANTSNLLTVEEVARVFRVDEATVRRWIKRGTLDAVILPSISDRQSYRITQEALNKALNATVVPTKANVHE